MATIRKRGDYQWQAIVRKAGFDPVYATFDTKKEAEIWAMETELSMEKDRYVNRSNVPTLHDALQRYLREVTVHKAKSTQSAEIKKAQIILAAPIAAKRLSDVTPDVLSAWTADLSTRQKKAGNTIRLYLALISHLYTVAASAWGLRDISNPVKAARASTPRPASGRERRLRPGECGLLMALLPYPYDHMAALAVETAMRREEIFEITKENVNLKNRSILLPRTKNGDARTVPLSPAALEIMEDILITENRQKKRKGLNRLWSAPENVDAISQMFGKYTADTPVEDLHFHDLRHEAVSRLFENTDLDAMEIARISGHKTWSQLSRYSHLRTDRLADRLAGKKR
ncbi:MAG: site-specific integrase [Acidithiobacillus sp.]